MTVPVVRVNTPPNVLTMLLISAASAKPGGRARTAVLVGHIPNTYWSKMFIDQGIIIYLYSSPVPTYPFF